MPEADQNQPVPPPLGNTQAAASYLSQIIELIKSEKVLVHHTDLKKLDPSSVQDHYRIVLDDYEVEVSHSKQADSGKDFYVMLFNNLKTIKEGGCDKVILAYIHLNDGQFEEFKAAAKAQIEKRRKEEEEKCFSAAMQPIDILFKKFSQPMSHSQADRQEDEPASEAVSDSPNEPESNDPPSNANSTNHSIFSEAI